MNEADSLEEFVRLADSPEGKLVTSVLGEMSKQCDMTPSHIVFAAYLGCNLAAGGYNAAIEAMNRLDMITSSWEQYKYILSHMAPVYKQDDTGEAYRQLVVWILFGAEMFYVLKARAEGIDVQERIYDIELRIRESLSIPIQELFEQRDE